MLRRGGGQVRRGGAREERAGRDPVQYYAQVHMYFAELPPERFPTTTALAPKLATGDGDDRFRFGLDLLVGGLAALAAQG